MGSLAQVLGRSPDRVTAQAATATATVPLSALRTGLPRGVTLRQAGRLRFTVSLGALPLHLRISSVRVGPAGLHIPAAGRDVHFATGG